MTSFKKFYALMVFEKEIHSHILQKHIKALGIEPAKFKVCANIAAFKLEEDYNLCCLLTEQALIKHVNILK